jgi:hypothetical protein
LIDALDESHFLTISAEFHFDWHDLKYGSLRRYRQLHYNPSLLFEQLFSSVILALILAPSPSPGVNNCFPGISDHDAPGQPSDLGFNCILQKTK